MLTHTVQNMIPVIRDFLANQPIRRAWLFGSCSRGEETDDSDIDLLVDFDESSGRISLFRRGGILMDLSELLGRRVDMIDNNGLLEFARESVNHDRILIYERTA